MGGEWKEALLADLYTIGSGLSKPAKDFGSGYPFLSFKDVFNNYFVPNELTQLVQSTEKEREQCSVLRGDIFLTRTSETMHELGMSCVALKDYERATFNGFTKRLRPKEGNNLIPEYVGYYLRSPKFRSAMLAFSTMSTRASLNNEMIGRLKISFPPINAQRAIGNTLKGLDDKIELNRQMNATLEAIAQALFKSWFVDFDPVIDNALAAGNPLPEELQARADARAALGDKRKPLPEAIQKQFPSRFVLTEEMGWVPEGWELVPLTKMVDSVSNTYPLKTVDKVVFLNTGDILEGNFLHSDYSHVAGLPGQAKKSIQKGDILFSEIRPINKRYALVDFESIDYVVSTKLMVLRAKGRFHPLFPYFLLKQEQTIRYLQHVAESRSGTFPQITYAQLEQVKVMIPATNDILDYFTSTILKGNFQRSSAIKSESSTLEKTRNALLPKLLSGELRIPDAERQVAEAV